MDATAVAYPKLTTFSELTIDGRLTLTPGGSSKALFAYYGTPLQQWFHAQRAAHDAIMVGAGTVRADNPELTVRHVAGANPLRVIPTNDGDLPDDAHVLRDGYLWREGGAVKLANIVTLLRGVLILPIAVFLLEGARWLALGLYLLAVLTDGLDGWLARRSGRMSDFGATLDAVVDNVFALAIALFLWLAMPQVYATHPLALGLLFLVPLAYLALSWLMTGRVLMFHFQSARVGALLLFALWPLLELTGATWLIGLTAAVVTLSRAEQVVFILRGGRDQDARHGGQAINTGVNT